MSSAVAGGPTVMTTAAILFPVGPAVRREQIPGLCAALAELFGAEPDAAVVCEVAASARPDVVLAEALARLQLTARRHGRHLEVRGAGCELRGLLDLLGLGCLLPAETGPANPAPPGPGSCP